MCGIAGFFQPDIQSDKGLEVLEHMLERIAHRGPDARGKKDLQQFFLGHNRLSIIDLQEASNQPFQRGSNYLVFNGEIYNYLEIKATLEKLGHNFVTASDTEVILAAYEVYGESCVDHFVGMWAFALLDTQQNKLFCSRDRFGIKPFYYHHTANHFVFASEAKAVLAHPDVPKRPNPVMIAKFLQHGWVDNGRDVFFDELLALPPANNLVLQNGAIKQWQYWSLPTKTHKIFDETAAAKGFSDALRESIRIHSRSDVALGSCLSGGLDSSAICSIQAHDNPQQKFEAFHIYYTGETGVDERPFAQAVVNRFAEQIELHTLSPDAKDLAKQFFDFMYHMEVPVPSSSPYSQYFVMQLARKNGVTVVLDGQGADEFLAGYKHGMYRFLHDTLKQDGLGKTLKAFKDLCEIKSIKGMAKLDLALKTALTFLMSENQLYRLEYKYFLPKLALANGLETITKQPYESRLQEFLHHSLFQTGLNNLLYYEDRNSMRWSLESRVPFLDHRVVAYVFEKAPHLILKNGWSKYLLRKGLSWILPEKITWRRDKKGFVTPGEILWMNGALKAQLMDTPWEFPAGTVDHQKAEKLKQAYRAGDRKNAQMVWRLAVLSYWYKEIFPKF